MQCRLILHTSRIECESIQNSITFSSFKLAGHGEVEHESSYATSLARTMASRGPPPPSPSRVSLHACQLPFTSVAIAVPLIYACTAIACRSQYRRMSPLQLEGAVLSWGSADPSSMHHWMAAIRKTTGSPHAFMRACYVGDVCPSLYPGFHGKSVGREFRVLKRKMSIETSSAYSPSPRHMRKCVGVAGVRARVMI
jgi:hypothetical protein